MEGSQAYLPKIGWVKFRKSQEIQGTIKETTILQEGSAWYISFCCEIEVPDPIPAPIDENRAIGIDVGLKVFATTSFVLRVWVSPVSSLKAQKNTQEPSAMQAGEVFYSALNIRQKNMENIS